jgi:hypothetical protein
MLSQLACLAGRQVMAIQVSEFLAMILIMLAKYIETVDGPVAGYLLLA